MTDLNENEKLRLLIGFRYMNDLLSEVERVMAAPGDEQGLFEKYVRDVTPSQRKDIEMFIALIRDEMLSILDEKGIRINPPDISAVKAIRNTIHFLDMAVEEMRPKHMRGYGALTENAVKEMDAVVSTMKSFHAQILKALIL